MTLRPFVGALLVVLAVAACSKDKTGAPVAMVEPVRPRSTPIEFVGLTVERAITLDEFHAFADPLFGAAAARGERHTNYELQPGLFLTVSPDPRTADQLIVSLEMVPMTAGATHRTVLRVPVSLAYGQLFIDTVHVALQQASDEPFELEYRVLSANGGQLTIHVGYDGAHSMLRIQTEDPRTSLQSGMVNTPAFGGDPYETIAGTVNFTLSRDEFAFFTTRAYGITPGAAQNFRDFQLHPHNWMRITINPRLADEMVDVVFDVVTADGRRLPFAKAPASFVAGEQFQQDVFRLIDNMQAQERAVPGSSTPWSSQFHYDDPEGGGVVKVIARGEHGIFRIAYAVESPTHRLRDVDFVPYMTELNIPDHIDVPDTTCSGLGSTDAVRGRFRIKFNASGTVRQSANLDGPLRGPVWLSVYHAADVTITGPKDGAVAVADYHFDAVDITDPEHLAEFETTADISAGEYQILGFMDIDGNGGTGDPDVNDPVTLPIGSYRMGCEVQPITVEFALLLPPGI